MIGITVEHLRRQVAVRADSDTFIRQRELGARISRVVAPLLVATLDTQRCNEWYVNSTFRRLWGATMPSWVLAATPDGPLATANLAEFTFYSDVG